MNSSQPRGVQDNSPWWRGLTRYHWFVLLVAALGWMFDCLDQQLFLLARVPALRDLLDAGQQPRLDEFSGYATSIFLIGWATGGLIFGVLGDRIGRAKTMLVTILLYSLFTGLSALSVGFWDFAFYRFLTGLGVGGEFAVGVALVAEVMPDRARPYALGLLQALSAIGNVSAALISMGLGQLEQAGTIGSSWRWMFVIGAFPAFLALIIRMKLKEPERWKAAKATGLSASQFGSYAELFGNPNWRKPIYVSSVCIIAIIAMAFAAPQDWPKLAIGSGLALIAVLAGLRGIYGGHGPAPWRRNAVVGLLLACSGVIGLWGIVFFVFDLVGLVLQKSFLAQGMDPAQVAGEVTYWKGVSSMMLNLGAFFGIYSFGIIGQRMGRRLAFAVMFLLSMLTTAMVFMFFTHKDQIYWMMPLMGFCMLGIFGGYAIYFPELFPTHLRSTGISFCYNVGRFVAASGPTILGLLTSRVFTEANGYSEGMRYAGLTMCAIFLLGLIVLPFAPETRGKSLPEDERTFAH